MIQLRSAFIDECPQPAGSIGRHLVALLGHRMMWGVNGACGVMASILAVMISMWAGIHTNLMIAAALYALLSLAMRRLATARS
jgi:hypothetical protein